MSLIKSIAARLSPSQDPPHKSGRLSSVLVTVAEEADGTESFVLTKRTMSVETHKGQISFPGGLHDAQDKHLMATALRESQEEIGLKTSDVQVLGGLPPVQTQGQVWIYPWVGVLQHPYGYVLNHEEVEKILYLPVERLLSEGLKQVTVNVGQYRVQSPGIEVDGEMVWGATARILEDIFHLLKAKT